MPEPRSGETREAFIPRAMAYIRREEPGKKRGFYWHKAVAIWNRARGK